MSDRRRVTGRERWLQPKHEGCDPKSRGLPAGKRNDHIFILKDHSPCSVESKSEGRKSGLEESRTGYWGTPHRDGSPLDWGGGFSRVREESKKFTDVKSGLKAELEDVVIVWKGMESSHIY